jgi:hypothetical protein
MTRSLLITLVTCIIAGTVQAQAMIGKSFDYVKNAMKKQGSTWDGNDDVSEYGGDVVGFGLVNHMKGARSFLTTYYFWFDQENHLCIKETINAPNKGFKLIISSYITSYYRTGGMTFKSPNGKIGVAIANEADGTSTAAFYSTKFFPGN